MIENGMLSVEDALRLAALSALLGYLAGIGIGWLLRHVRGYRDRPKRYEFGDLIPAGGHGFVTHDLVVMDPPVHVRVIDGQDDDRPYDWKQERKGVH